MDKRSSTSRAEEWKLIDDVVLPNSIWSGKPTHFGCGIFPVGRVEKPDRTLATGNILLTRNRPDFGMVPGLTIEDWSTA